MSPNPNPGKLLQTSNKPCPFYSALGLLLLMVVAWTPLSGHADGITGELKLTRLSWGTNGDELNDAGLTSLFRRDIDVTALAIDTYIGYRFDHNRSMSTAIGFLYGRGLTKTELREFGMINRYHFKSWFGLGYKGIYKILARPNLELFWHLSLIDFNLDALETSDSSTEPVRINGLFSGWGFGLGITITQFLISYHVYTVNVGTCGTCDETHFHTISVGWQFN